MLVLSIRLQGPPSLVRYSCRAPGIARYTPVSHMRASEACAHYVMISLMEAILACHPARSTEWMAKWCEVLQASLVPCAQLRSTRFPHSFRFPSDSSSRHLSSFLCQTVPICNRSPSSVISSTSSSFRSAVRLYFVLDMFSHGFS